MSDANQESKVPSKYSVSKMVVEPLKKLTSEIMESKKLSEDSMKTLKQVSSVLSSILPRVSDSTLFEIDDLLYPNYGVSADATFCGTGTADTMREVQDCMQSYCTIHIFIIAVVKVVDRTLDTTYLQVTEHIPTELTFGEYPYSALLLCVNKLLSSRCFVNVCRALKLLKVALRDKIFEKFLKQKRRYLYKAIFLSKLKDIPQAKHPDEKRVTMWLASQAAALLGKVDIAQLKSQTPTHNYIELYLSKEKKDFEPTFGAHINSLIESTSFELEFDPVLFPIGFKQDGITFHLEHLHAYFTSARDKYEKLLLIQILCGNSAKDSYSYQQHGLTVTDLLTRRFSSFVKYFYYFLEYLVKEVHYSNDLLNDIDTYNNYDFEPYLSKSNFNLIDETIEVQKKENFCSDGEKESSFKSDFTIQKFLVYEEFMKSLEVMNILHTACLVNTEWFRRAHNNPIKKYINKALSEGSKPSKVPWWIIKTVEKCSFMVLSEHLEHLKEDLVRMLKGGNVGEVVEERLYFAVNTTQDGDQLF